MVCPRRRLETTTTDNESRNDVIFACFVSQVLGLVFHLKSQISSTRAKHKHQLTTVQPKHKPRPHLIPFLMWRPIDFEPVFGCFFHSDSELPTWSDLTVVIVHVCMYVDVSLFSELFVHFRFGFELCIETIETNLSRMTSFHELKGQGSTTKPVHMHDHATQSIDVFFGFHGQCPDAAIVLINQLSLTGLHRLIDFSLLHWV